MGCVYSVVQDDEIGLDFDDVMIKPKFSRLSSRSQVNLEKYFSFKNPYNTQPITWSGIPIIAANMDTTEHLKFIMF